MPIDEAWSLVSLKEHSEGAHKQLPAGSRLVISISPEEEAQEELLISLKEAGNIEFILPEGLSLSSAGAHDPGQRRTKIIADPIRKEHGRDLVDYIDLGSYFHFNKVSSSLSVLR
ncbi:hypothetical protein AXF42_Ash001352 [Apostasia shenzhenica]|uniref:Uncharacterized protein n=1 Tax=Apostasia shenzhenica TaxID=1088818 RepID=A0A2I0AUP2_9ASPA|nr:hypothetical protein AXF42_Ash001352 [Apostasia shenzhenica]